MQFTTCIVSLSIHVKSLVFDYLVYNWPIWLPHNTIRLTKDGANVKHFEGYARIIDPHTVEVAT